MFLTAAELHELTGYRSARHQARWLRDRSWKFELDRAGRPRVSRAYAEQRMGVRGVEQERPRANWSALNAT